MMKEKPLLTHWRYLAIYVLRVEYYARKKELACVVGAVIWPLSVGWFGSHVAEMAPADNGRLLSQHETQLPHSLVNTHNDYERSYIF